MLVFISKKLHFQCPLCHLQRVLKLRNMGSSDAIYFESLHQDQLLDPPQLLPSLTTPTLPGKTKENLTPPNAATYKKHTRQNVKDMNQIPRRSLWVSFIYNTEWNSVELEVGGEAVFTAGLSLQHRLQAWALSAAQKENLEQLDRKNKSKKY